MRYCLFGFLARVQLRQNHASRKRVRVVAKIVKVNGLQLLRTRIGGILVLALRHVERWSAKDTPKHVLYNSKNVWRIK